MLSRSAALLDVTGHEPTVVENASGGELSLSLAFAPEDFDRSQCPGDLLLSEARSYQHCGVRAGAVQLLDATLNQRRGLLDQFLRFSQKVFDHSDLPPRRRPQAARGPENLSEFTDIHLSSLLSTPGGFSLALAVRRAVWKHRNGADTGPRGPQPSRTFLTCRAARSTW